MKLPKLGETVKFLTDLVFLAIILFIALDYKYRALDLEVQLQQMKQDISIQQCLEQEEL